MKTDCKRPWETHYAQSGTLWRGRAGKLPPEIKAGSKVLELGCGNGKTAAALSALPLEVHAIDFSETAVGLCREAVRNAGGNAKVAEMDGKKLGYPEGYFDAVLCFHYLAHFDADGRAKAAGEAARVLKPGGKLYFRDFGTGDFRFGAGEHLPEKQTFCRRGIITHYFTKNEAMGLFSGLRLEKAETKGWKMGKFKRQEIWAEFSKSPN